MSDLLWDFSDTSTVSHHEVVSDGHLAVFPGPSLLSCHEPFYFCIHVEVVGDSIFGMELPTLLEGVVHDVLEGVHDVPGEADMLGIHRQGKGIAEA